MTSEIRANTLKNRVGLGTVSFTDSGPVVSGIVTANTLRLPDATSGSLGRLQFGNGLHYTMYHDGSNSFLVNNNGYLSIQSQSGVGGIFIARNAEVNLYYGGSVRLQTSSSGVTINRDLDVDGHTNLDNVNIAGITTFANTVHAASVLASYVSSSGNIFATGNLQAQGDIIGTGDLTLTFIDAGSAAGPELKLFRNSASPANADYLGQIKFAGESSTGVERNYAKITGKILDVTNGSEDGILEFAHIKAGSQTITGRWRSDSLQLLNGTALTVAGSTTVTGNIIPSSDSATDIGTNSVRFANIYADTLYGSGANLTGINADLVNDTSPQLGGTLQSNGYMIRFADASGVNSNRLKFGTGDDLHVYHNGSNSTIRHEGTGSLLLTTVTGSIQLLNGSENMLVATPNGAVNLYYDHGLRLATDSGGVTVTGGVDSTTGIFERTNNGTSQIEFSATNETKIKHLSNSQCKLSFVGYNNVYGGSIDAQTNSNYIRILTASSEQAVVCRTDAQVELYFNNSKKYETQEVGANFYGRSVDCQLRFKTSDGTTRGSVYAYQDNSIALLDASGNYSLRTNSDKSTTFFNHAKPNADNSYDLGTSSLRWRNLYTTDLQLSNEGSTNDVDGTWGDWTLQEGENKIFMINNRTGKKYSLIMEEE